jgi:hypothetical protein
MKGRNATFVPSLVFTAICFVIGAGMLFAQTGDNSESGKPRRNPSMSYSNFDITKVNFKDPLVRENTQYLTEYYICRAAQKDSSRECSGSGSSSVRSECNYYFNDYQLAYGRLFKNGRVVPSFLAACYSNGGEFDDEKLCNEFGQAILSGSEGFCSKFTDLNAQKGCLSMMSSNYQGHWPKSVYINAIRSRDIRKCERINDPKARAACIGMLSSDPKVCENNDGFKFFKQRYFEGN